MRNYFLIILGAAFFVVCCTKVGEPCDETKFASAVVIDFPDSLNAVATHELKIQYIIENSCGSFTEFQDTTIGDVTEVKIITDYVGCNCTLEFVEEERFYPLHHDSTGTYHYKFWMSETEFDEYTLTVF